METRLGIQDLAGKTNKNKRRQQEARQDTRLKSGIPKGKNRWP